MPGPRHASAEERDGGRRGAVPDAIVVIAHRDDAGAGPGANDNASAPPRSSSSRASYAQLRRHRAARVRPAHTLVFLSTDAGRSAASAPAVRAALAVRDVVAAVNLDALGGHGHAAARDRRRRAPLAVRRRSSRRRRARRRADGRARRRGTSFVGQLLDLGFPFSLYEQAPVRRARDPGA